MGEHQVGTSHDERRLREFMRSLLDDLRALEQMLDGGLIESGVRRIGAEQEMFLVDAHSLRPAPVACEALSLASDPRLTTEIARFNIEANLTPRPLAGDCFSRLEEEIKETVAAARAAARALGADVLLAGILPTLRKSDLTLDSVTPSPRYYELNRAIMAARGGAIRVHIKGVDEVNLSSDNIMLLSSNTSFQVHLQVGPEEFAPLYNVAQLATAPVLAAAVNSPLWLGHRLWQETRLALFQHSADARSGAEEARGLPTRVGFGDRWLAGSIAELFREDIARFRVILTTEVDEVSTETLRRGGVPRLRALQLHNGTVWWWNRPCYGVTEGRPHLRIENRVIPSGPTPLDEAANAAFFVGLMQALPNEYGDVTRLMAFEDCKANFWRAARNGLGTQLFWLDGKSYPAPSLILERLLPLARGGLRSSGVDEGDVERYLGVVEERVRTGQTGARWAVRSLAAFGNKGTKEVRMRALARAVFARQQTNEPVHRWPLAEPAEAEDWRESYRTVGQFMSTDLFTVRPDDLVDLVASVMDWRHIRHVPVEDERGRLVGLITHRDLLRFLARGGAERAAGDPLAVSEIMKRDPVTVTPSTTSLEAVALMRERRVGCLPVVEGGALVGIITAYDFLAATAEIFQEQMSEPHGGESAGGSVERGVMSDELKRRPS
jgi:CBS domain-containing protein/gamma-glutamyl:cysteine ligase YbdK (ATP-grasp superfamily)